MEIGGILYALLISLLGLWILTKRFPGFEKRILITTYILKISATLGLYALYTYYYQDRSTADIYRFFDDGLILHSIAYDQPLDFLKILIGFGYDQSAFRLDYFELMNAWIKPFDAGFYNDNHIMIKLNALMRFLSFGHEEVHGVLFSFLSFIGMLLLIDTIVPKSSKNIVLLVTGLFPSSLLWLSGSLKEALLMFGIGLFIYSFIQRKSMKLHMFWLYSFTGISILFSVKIYHLAFLFPAIMAVAMARELLKMNRLILPVWGAIIILMFSIVCFVGIDPLASISQKQQDFINVASSTQAGSAFEMEVLEPNFKSVLSSLPQALVNATIRPFPNEITSPLEWSLVFENLVLMLILLLSLYCMFKFQVQLYSHWWLLLMIIPVLVLTGLVTPVFGAIMRYRAPAMVMLLMLLIPVIHVNIPQQTK